MRAVVDAHSSVARSTLVASEARAQASGAITSATVGALRVEVAFVRLHGKQRVRRRVTRSCTVQLHRMALPPAILAVLQTSAQSAKHSEARADAPESVTKQTH